LMRLLADASPEQSDRAVGRILDQLDRLRQGGAMFFQQNPTLEKRLTEIRSQDHRYVAHEYLNRDWHPMMFAEVADAMAEAKCRFIGSATLAENIDAASIPPGVQPLLGGTSDQRLRETLRDIATARGFRRDIYRRGVTPMLRAEQQSQIDALAFGWTGLATGDNVVFSTGIGTITGNAELYKPLLERLHAGPATVRELREIPGLKQHLITDLLQALTLLMASGYIHPLLPKPTNQAPAHALNSAIVALNAAGGDLPRLAIPPMGTALTFDLLEILVIGALADGVPADPAPLAEEALRRLATGGRSMQRDGAAISDHQEAMTSASNAITQILTNRLDLLRGLQLFPS
jgi:Predicted methyltransferase regulatory domain